MYFAFRRIQKIYQCILTRKVGRYSTRICSMDELSLDWYKRIRSRISEPKSFVYGYTNKEQNQ